MTDLDRVRAAFPRLRDEVPPATTVARLQSLYADALDESGHGAQHRGLWRWARSRRLGVLAIGCMIAGGTAIAATVGGWHPLLGSPDRGPQPLAARAGVPADQLAALGVLRRPQTGADRGPLVRRALQVFNRETINGIHTDAIRLIYQGPREAIVLIPAERVGPNHQGEPFPVQRNALCLMSGSYQHAQKIVVTSGGKPKGIRLPAGYTWGMACGGTKMLRTTGIQTGTNPSGGGLVVDGHPKHLINRRVTLVPDGVASVKVRLRHGRSLTAPVRDNVYTYTIHGVSAYLGTTWFGPTGQRIDRPAHH